MQDMTMDQVEDAIQDALALPMSPPKAMRIRAGVLADLYQTQARLFREAGQAKAMVPSVYRHACELAASRLADTSTFFRGQAGARR